MIEALIRMSMRNRFLILVFTGLMVAIGIFNMNRLPIGAVPDVTNIQVQVLSNAPALGPEEVERFITFPIEQAMSGIPKVTQVRSISRPGLSAVTVVFEEGTDIYWCRQLVAERLSSAREAIPEGTADIEMGPISTGLGEIYQFEVKAEDGALNPETGKPYTPMDLRTILDWQVAYQLRSVPGIVEINTFGGLLKTYEVQIDPDKLRSYRMGINEVFKALEENNGNAGGAYIQRSGEALYIRGEGLIETIADIENVVVDSRKEGTPIFVKNLGTVALAPMVRQGAVSRDGRGEAVTGIVMMLMGENARVVVNRVTKKIEEVKKTLPKGVILDTFYDRTDLVRKTIKTATWNLTEGAILVVIVLLLLLGNIRGGLLVAMAIPLSMLFAITAMVYADISGNLMSLGAIDFGIIVDGAVVMVENFYRHLSLRKNKDRSTFDVIQEAALEVGRPVVFAVMIITIVYIPLLTLEGIEGKMFKPMALTVMFALVGSLLLAIFLMPAAGSLLLGRRKKKEGDEESSGTPDAEEEEDHDTFVVRWIKALYKPTLRLCMKNPIITVILFVALFVSSLFIARTMGAEFIPKLDEGAIALQAWRLPSVSLEQSLVNTQAIESVLKSSDFPEVDTVISKTGRAEIATDPMGVEISDIYVMLKPRSEWTVDSKEALVEKIDKHLQEKVPGTLFSYSQPIELRVSELIAGVRSEIAVKIYGDDLKVLKEKADEVAKAISSVRGSADVKAEQVAGLPVLRVRVKRAEIARYGINAHEVLDTVAALGGKEVGTVFEGQRRFTLQVRIAENARENIDKIRAIRVADPKGRLIPLGQLADIEVKEGPAQISRENIRRRINVEVNVRGRDLASFVSDGKKAVESQVKLPPGYVVEWGGQFENLERATLRLMIVVPLTLFLIFVLLYITYSSIKPALLIFLNVPMAATGGIFALWFRDMPFSISAGVGFIALFGIAVMNGVVLVSFIRDLHGSGKSLEDSIWKGAMTRLRPVLMTAITDGIGFLPMAISVSEGAEVQRPLATVVIGGLLTSFMLTMLVLPSIYGWFADEVTTPLATPLSDSGSIGGTEVNEEQIQVEE
jgi:heavy metal efflux system protein